MHGENMPSDNSAILYWPADEQGDSQRPPRPAFVTAASMADLSPMEAGAPLTDRALCLAKIRGQDCGPCVLVWLSREDTVEQLKHELITQEKRYITKGHQYWEEAKTLEILAQKSSTMKPEPERREKNVTFPIDAEAPVFDMNRAPPPRAAAARSSMPAVPVQQTASRKRGRPSKKAVAPAAAPTKRTTATKRSKRAHAQTDGESSPKRLRSQSANAKQTPSGKKKLGSVPVRLNGRQEETGPNETVEEPAGTSSANGSQLRLTNPTPAGFVAVKDVLAGMKKQHTWGAAFGQCLRVFFEEDEIRNGYWSRPRNEEGQVLDKNRVDKLKELLLRYCQDKGTDMPTDSELGRKFASIKSMSKRQTEKTELEKNMDLADDEEENAGNDAGHSEINGAGEEPEVEGDQSMESE